MERNNPALIRTKSGESAAEVFARLKAGVETFDGEESTLELDGIEVTLSSRYVGVGDVLVPETMVISTPGDASTPSVRARVEVRDGAPRVVSIAFESGPADGEVRQSHLRSVEVSALLEFHGGMAMKIEDTDDGAVVSFGERLDGAAVARTIRNERSRRRLTRAFLEQVAEVYRANIDHAPTRAVRERFYVSERAASGYVAAARDAGLLPPTSQGRKNA